MDYPFKKERLDVIDYESIISEGVKWTDPTFRPEESSLLD